MHSIARVGDNVAIVVAAVAVAAAAAVAAVFGFASHQT